MLGNRFTAPTRGSTSWTLHVGACALLLGACNVYDAKLLREPSMPPPSDAGHGTGGADAGGAADAGPCVVMPEICNALDDDCDGRIDEETTAYCQSIVVNAETKCVPLGQGAACVRLSCHEGFDDCDGRPQNGCEKPRCACNECGDAGEDTDAGR